MKWITCWQQVIRMLFCQLGQAHSLKEKNGAEGGTRTPIGCPTRPSIVRVYQFHHFGNLLVNLTPVIIKHSPCSLQARVGEKVQKLEVRS